MKTKRRFYSFRPFNLFVLTVFQVNVASSLNNGQSFSSEESEQFISSENTNESRMKITFLNLENVYSIDDEYTFFIPEITSECECACTERDEEYCSERTYGYNRKCAYWMNSTSTCTMYNSIGRETSVCPYYYRMCCSIYLSKSKLINSYRALHLKYKSSNIRIEVDLQSTPAKENVFNVFIPPDVKYLQFISENLLHTFDVESLILPDVWYFTQDGANELLFTENINKKHEYNLDKLGWFQLKPRDNELSRVRIMDLKQSLEVKPSNCYSLPPKFEWKLHAEGFYKEGLLKLPKDTRKVSVIYQNSVTKISLNFKDKIIITESKESPNVNVSSVKIESLPFFFFCNISVFADKKPFLNLTFYKGSGSMLIEIANPSWENTVTFSIFVKNASADSPFTFSYGLSFTNIELFMVCVSHGELKLCQSPTVFRERTTTFQEPTGDTTQTFNVSSDIRKENATKDYQQEKGQQEQTSPFSLDPITAIIIPISILLSLPIALIVYLKRRKEIQLKKNHPNENDLELSERLTKVDKEIKLKYKEVDETKPLNHITS